MMVRGIFFLFVESIDVSAIDTQYASRASEASSEQDYVEPTDFSHRDDVQFLRYAQFLVRLIGVCFVIEGIAALVGGGLYTVTQSVALAQAGIEGHTDIQLTPNG